MSLHELYGKRLFISLFNVLLLAICEQKTPVLYTILMFLFKIVVPIPQNGGAILSFTLLHNHLQILKQGQSTICSYFFLLFLAAVNMKDVPLPETLYHMNVLYLQSLKVEMAQSQRRKESCSVSR